MFVDRENPRLQRAMRGKWIRSVVGILVILVLAFGTVSAEPHETIINNGDPLNRIDIAIVGDGYTAVEMISYRQDVALFMQRLFQQEPYLEYSAYFNVHRIDVVSNESGADHPERNPQVFVDTAFDASYNCGGIVRLICVNDAAVNQVITSSLPSGHYDIKLVLVNDAEYGGSGGAIAVASRHLSAVELILHEVGHSFGLLADEYVSGGPACNPNVEPPEPNATRETIREQIKWNSWIDIATPIPTTTTVNGIPGLYEGARYCSQGLYRPTHDSKMRTLGRPFEQINSEQHVKRIYTFVSPIDSFSPLNPAQIIRPDESIDFSVATPAPATHSLSVAWTVNGQPVGTGTDFEFTGAVFGKGQFELKATVSDSTAMVRNDPAGLLVDSMTWQVQVRAPSGGARFDFDGDSKTDASIFRPSPTNIVAGPTAEGSTSQWWILRSSDLGTRGLQFGNSTDIPAAADFTGDGRTDIAFFRPESGFWYILRSEDDTYFAFPFGAPGDLPAPGDFDADGRADPAVFRASAGTWFIFRSSDSGVTIVPFGSPGDTPVVGDFDGDGRADVSIRRFQQWWQLRTTEGVKSYTFGGPADVTAVEDWTGDGTSDVAFYRAAEGRWFVIRSEDDTYFSFPWGVSTDIPAPGDYDGDGVADPAVWRPDDRTWYIFGTTSGFQAIQFGSDGDVPLPAYPHSMN